MTRVAGLRTRPGQLVACSGWNLLVTDDLGRIGGGGWPGFYADNTRVLSAEELTVDGRPVEPFCAGVVGTAILGYAVVADGEKSLRRGCYLEIARFAGDGLRTRLAFTGYAAEPRTVRLAIRAEADFADDEEVERGEREQTAPVTVTWTGHELLLRYDHPGLDRAVAVATSPPARYEDGCLLLDVEVPARGNATVEVIVEPVFDGRRRQAPPATYEHEPLFTTARLRSTGTDVANAWATAVDDLARLPLGLEEGPAAPVAGLPMYQQFFGRDTLTASWQALLATPVPLRDSLRANAAWRGRRIDDWYDEEPGKMIHQVRRGPLAVLGREPFLRYYGDFATPLDFLAFLGQYLAWTGDLATVRELLPAAREAVGWCERYGDPDGDGFLEYDTRSKQGVRNQGWKDSETAIVDEHGDPVPNPLAVSELQGYWYAALRHCALAFAAAGDRWYAGQLVARARTLKKRFDAAYWLPDLGCYAMGLDARKQAIRSVNSNDGHLLACGIVPRHRAKVVARRLFEPDMFSGWGVRTLSADHPAYDPFSYHRGSVWPVESGTIALGLARYGCTAELHRLAEATFSASALFAEHRLPEALSGLPRDAGHPHPGIYPRSNAPQAWSASAIVAVVQALLAFRPFAPAGVVLVDPHLPPWLPDLTLEGIRVGQSLLDLSVRGGRLRWRCREGRLRVLRAPTWQSL